MEIVYSDPAGDGVVVVNPRDVVRLVENSRHRAAAVVIDGDDVAVCTIQGSDHAQIASRAGFSGHWLDPSLLPDTIDGALCLIMHPTGISLELWPWEDGPECPVSEEHLAYLYERVSNHPRLRRAVRNGLAVGISVFDGDGVERWAYPQTEPVAAISL